MATFLPSPAEAIRKPLAQVVAGVLARGAPAPAWIAVDDDSGSWPALAAARPLAERRRAVLAAARDEALVAGVRLGIGGALGLPPSTPAMEAALAAAAAAHGGRELCDPEVAALAVAGARVTVWTFRNLGFWKRQLGEPALASLLFDLAHRLRLPPAILAWPAMLVTGRTRREVGAAWKERPCGQPAPTQGLQALQVTRRGDDPLLAAYRALVEGGGESERQSRTLAEPVHELPSGRLLGFWAPCECKTVGGGWLATPAARGASPATWVLRSEHRKRKIVEVLAAAEIAEVRDAAAVRVPGWATGDLRPATPAGLLVSRLAERAAREGSPLWVPNVEAQALHFVLGLPGTLWVDGPAVPRGSEEVKRRRGKEVKE